MSLYAKRLSAVFVFVYILSGAFFLHCTAEAAVVEADRDLQAVLGDIGALTVAMRLHYEDTRSAELPASAQLTRYIQNFSVSAFTSDGDYRIAGVEGEWWVGRRVAEFSRARPFLRARAEEYGLYDEPRGSLWLGGSFVWRKAVAVVPGRSPGKKTAPEALSDIQTAPGEGQDGQVLFFCVQNTDRFWWSKLRFSDVARADALEKFALAGAGLLSIPPAPLGEKEDLRASPVFVPPEFTVRMTDSDDFTGVEMGDVIFTPIPRGRGNQ